MSDIFISYSRKDIDFAQKIVDALTTNDLDTWIDWKSIPKGEDWEKEIYRGIEEADAFLFLISPNSVASEMCNKEIAHAVKNGKRILPIFISGVENWEVYGITEKFLTREAREEINRRNFIFCREGKDEFNKTIEEIRTTIHIDYEWLKYHTELQVKALKWAQKKDNSRLLRGKELRDAEQQLAEVSVQVDPQPTRVQREYILISRRNEDRQRQRILAAVVIGTVVMLVITIVAIMQRQIALKQQRIARARELSALSMVLPDSLPQRRLLLAISALNNLTPSDPRIPFLETNLRNFMVGMGGTIPSSSIISNSLAFSPDSLWLIARDADGLVKSWDIHNLSVAPKVLLDQSTTGFLIIGPPTSSTPNGKWLATGGDASIELWDLQKPEAKPIRLNLAQNNTAESIAFSPDGKWLAVGENEVVEVWDLRNPAQKPHEFEHEPDVTALAFNPDGNTLATGTFFGYIRLWDMQELTLQKELTNQDGAPISSMAFSPDGVWLAVGRRDNNVQLWDIHGMGTQPLDLDYKDSGSMAFSPDRRWLATGGDDTTIQLWDVQNSFAKGQNIKGFEGGVTYLVFSPDSQWIAVRDGNRISHLLNLHELYSEPIVLNGDPGYGALDFVKFIDGRWIVANIWDQPIQVWDLQNPNLDPIFLKKSGDYDMSNVVLSPNQRWLATSSGISTWEFWDLRTPTEPSKNIEVDVLARAPHGEWLLINDTVQGGSLLNMDNPLASPLPLRDFRNMIEVKAVSEDGHWLLAVDENNSPFLWDTQKPDLTPIELLNYGEIETVPGMTFSSNGRWFAKGDNSGRVKVWDLQNTPNGLPLVYDTQIEDTVCGLEFNPDGRRLAIQIGLPDSFTLQIVDIQGSSLKKVFETQNATSEKFSPVGKWLAFGGFDGIDHLLDMQPMNLRAVSLLGLHNNPIEELVFSPDENMLASTSKRNTQYTSYGGGVFNTSNDIVFWWDLRDPSSSPVQLPGRAPLVFSSDGKWLVLSNDTGFRLWHVKIGEVKEIACQIVGRNFTWEEWQLYFSGKEPYKTCDQWPSPVELTPIPILTP